jgi:hypothetical protein
MGWLSLLRGGKKVAGAIRSVKPAKNLTKRRRDQQELFKVVDHQYKKAGVTSGSGASKIKKDSARKVSALHDKYEKASSEVKKYNKNLKRKTIGAGAVAVGGITGAHITAKKKYPGYKKWMERDIKIKDGKVKLVPKKKK